MLKWYEHEETAGDIVISSRIRLARNFNDYLFADKISEEDAAKMINSVAKRFETDYPEEFRCLYMKECSESGRNALKEKRVITSYLAGKNNGAVILSEDEGTSVLLNGEDHVRIQVLCNGMDIQSCFKKANEIDDYIDAHFDYAFDEKYGYKTTFPTNTGTGMKAGYTLHLPSLSDARRLNDISAELGRFGLKFRTVYGDGQNGYGNLYQISTQKTLGQDEREVIKDLDDIVLQIVNQEKEQREHFYKKDKIQMDDEIYKSYGVLKYARKLSLKDSMVLISELMTGISLGVLQFAHNGRYNINELIMDIQPAVLRQNSGKTMSVAETDVLRAEYIRKYLPEII